MNTLDYLCIAVVVAGALLLTPFIAACCAAARADRAIKRSMDDL